MMLRNRVDSDSEILDKLNKLYPWIPNSKSIRPSPQIIEKKKHLIQQIELNWKSPKDYIIHTIFGEKYYVDEEFDNKKFVPSKNFKSNNYKWFFQPSIFPYNLECKETNHWVLWNSEKNFDFDFPEEEINEIIKRHLFYHTQIGTSFEFVWYKNPKPTIKDFYHIQVFWISGCLEKENNKKQNNKISKKTNEISDLPVSNIEY